MPICRSRCALGSVTRELVLHGKLDAAQPTLGERLHETAEHLRHRLAANYVLAARHHKLHLVGILRHQAMPVATIERVEVLGQHGGGCGLRLQWRKLAGVSLPGAADRHDGHQHGDT